LEKKEKNPGNRSTGSDRAGKTGRGFEPKKNKGFRGNPLKKKIEKKKNHKKKGRSARKRDFERFAVRGQKNWTGDFHQRRSRRELGGGKVPPARGEDEGNERENDHPSTPTSHRGTCKTPRCPPYLRSKRGGPKSS